MKKFDLTCEDIRQREQIEKIKEIAAHVARRYREWPSAKHTVNLTVQILSSDGDVFGLEAGVTQVWCPVLYPKTHRRRTIYDPTKLYMALDAIHQQIEFELKTDGSVSVVVRRQVRETVAKVRASTAMSIAG